ncbi:hypothetical protein [Haematobacter missouriensis]|uniref:Uncharacterized protein n=1 Tax=Haematobacter missouriensis TaxID=366616 RepID=A0A212AI28_9RHOB|nr:hypothetical protein [Haematobacter missouriensis]OWJ70436.1 hypothetical protein CDV53_20640 [Haematobacter missouriensis]OWJ81117.1 hypothetical protein CDV52_19475 [Haematobacter missouriensis]
MIGPIPLPLTSSRATAEALLMRAPQDLVFTMRFLGQSQEILHSHFREFLETRLAEHGVTAERHPLLPFFIDSHAVELRDFVTTGVSLARSFRLAEIEILIGDVETQMRVDIWDALAAHIDMAESRFSRGISKVVSSLEEAEAGIRGGNP